MATVLGDDNEFVAGLVEQLVGGALEDERAPLNDDELIAGSLDLGEQMAGDDDRLADLPETDQQLPDLDDACRIQPVGRLVEDHHLRVLEQRCGDRQALLHAERVVAGPVTVAAGEVDQVEDFVDPLVADAGQHRKGAQVVPAAQLGVDDRSLDQCPDPSHVRTRAGDIVTQDCSRS